MRGRSGFNVSVLAFVALVNSLAWAGGFVDLMEYASESEFLAEYTKIKDEYTGTGDWDAVFDGDRLIVDEITMFDVPSWNHIYARRSLGGDGTGDIKMTMHFTWNSTNPAADRGRIALELLTAPGTGTSVDADWPNDHVAEVAIWDDFGEMAMSTVIEEVQRLGDIDRTDAFPFAPFSDSIVGAAGEATAIIQRVGDQLTLTFDGGENFQTATRTDTQTYTTVGITLCDFNGYPGLYDGNPLFTVDRLTVLTGEIWGTINESDGATNVEEGGATDSYEVVLNREPAGNVELRVTPLVNGLAVRLNGGDPNEPAVFPITLADWDQPRLITVEAVDDDLGGDRVAVLAHTFIADANSGVADYVLVNIADNDAGIQLVESDDATEVTEGGMSDTYSVVLEAAPSAGRTVTIWAETDGQTALSVGGSDPALTVGLDFDGENWYVPQDITVFAVDDEVLEFDHVSVITHTVSSDDLNYDGYKLDSLEATVHDNECGVWGYPAMDVNRDCVVNLSDFAIFCDSWLDCTMPFVCTEPNMAPVFWSEGAPLGGYDGFGTTFFDETDVALLYGAASGYNSINANFTLTEWPNQLMYVYIRGHNDDVANTVETALWMNGTEIYRGANVFLPEGGWATLVVPVPVGVLNVGSNDLVLSNLSAGGIGSPPWFMVDWVAVAPFGYQPEP